MCDSCDCALYIMHVYLLIICELLCGWQLLGIYVHVLMGFVYLHMGGI